MPQQTQAQKDFPASVWEVVLSGVLNNDHRCPFYNKKDKAEAEKNMEKLNILDLKKRCYRELSGGQQQRVSVARALVNDPKIIFADEPTGALDSHTSQDVMRLMQRLVREQKRTLVMVTHDRSQAEYADRVLEIIDGKIVHITENRRKEENERA